METKPKEGIPKVFLFILVVSLIAIGTFQFALSTPYGPIEEASTTESVDIGFANGLLMNDTKGRVTRVTLNATQPNADWKGYVGNITGKLKLVDANNNTLFDWTLTTLSGEIFATRASTAPSWVDISCATHSEVSTENTAMGHGNEIDNMTNTFDNGNHKQVEVGGNTIGANSCTYSEYTYVSSASQAVNFSEVLLHDGTNIVYASVLESDATGYDGQALDFQMIVADNQDTAVNTGYYFYVELA